MLKLLAFVWLTLDLSGSAGGTLASGRCVMAHSDAWSVECEFGKETATIVTGGHEVLVAPMQITVDGKVVVPIAEATQSVVVSLHDGTITLVADGVTVAECRR